MQDKRHNPHYQAQEILSRRAHSVAEMRTKLKRKGFAPVVIDETVVWLTQQRLLDDDDFARQYVSSTLLQKPVGPRWLTAKLKEKGVPESVVQSVLEEFVDHEQEKELVKRAAERWQRSHPRDQGNKMRLYRFLVARGFTSAAISASK